MSEVKVNKITPTTNCGTVTLGDSGDTISIPAGVTLDVQGTASGFTDITWDTTAKTAGFTAVAGNGYFVNTTSGAITVTLPATPSVGNFVGIKDYANTADTNNITIARNGSNIQGTANDFIISTEGLSIILIYVDATQGWVSTGSAQASDIVKENLFVAATGGTIVCCGDYKIHTFTGPGTFTVTNAGSPSGSDTVDYMVVAGGGGGGRGAAPAYSGAGGGAGGFREGFNPGSYCASPLATTSLPVSITGYPITVGGGGAGSTLTACAGTSGSNSIFSTITSAGGGGAGSPGADALDGGSGGGAAASRAGTFGAGNTPPTSPAQGLPGGNYGPGPLNYVSGGGGGATQAGFDSASGAGGPGGNGATTSISGSPTAYAGGGGSGGSNYNMASAAGSGGTGGGGPGGATSVVGTAGTVNTGGGAGGGGRSASGGAGGSGIVIIRYKFQ